MCWQNSCGILLIPAFLFPPPLWPFPIVTCTSWHCLFPMNESWRCLHHCYVLLLSRKLLLVDSVWGFGTASFVCSLYVYMYNIIRKTWKGINQTKMEGGQSGTYQRLMIGVIGSAVERCKDVEMKRKSEKIYNNWSFRTKTLLPSEVAPW